MQDVIFGTNTFIKLMSFTWVPKDELDKKFQWLMAHAANVTLQTIRKEGLSNESIVKIGKLLLRMYKLREIYLKKRETYSLSEWVSEIEDVIASLVKVSA